MCFMGAKCTTEASRMFWVAILAPPHNPTLYWTSFFQKSLHTYSHSYFQSEKSRTETNQNNLSFLWRGSYLQICPTNGVSSQPPPPPPQKECCIQNQRKKSFNLTSSASHWHWKMLLKSKMAISFFFQSSSGPRALQGASQNLKFCPHPMR